VSEKTTAVSAWEALFRAQVAVMRQLHAEFPTGDISFTEYDVLFNLSRQPDWQLRIKDLNQQILLTQPSVSRLVDRLAARELVTKSHDPDDARGVLVRLTDKGYQLFRQAAVSHIRSITERVGTALSPEELDHLVALCDKLRLGSASSASNGGSARGVGTDF
jgi:DNA-binding MarR family transcriptional regulator